MRGAEGELSAGCDQERHMDTIRILALLAALLATTCVVTPASACPNGYFPCGNACCPAGR
jgi:hypothetical protein